MRELEIAIVCWVFAGAGLALLVPRMTSGQLARGRLLFVIPVYCCLLAVLLTGHLVFEGAHWQAVPVYFAALIAALLLWFQPARVRGILGATLVVAFAVVGCGLSYVLPVFPLPEPTGIYAIGTHIVSMVDASRKEDADTIGTRSREVVVQIWYPALPSHAPRAPYRRRNETSLAASYQSVDWTHARYDTPVANGAGGFPVLLYNPGWNGRRTQNTFLVEELVSHGYVVVAIDHPYNSGPVELADGRVIQPITTPELVDNVTPPATLYALINQEVAKETDDTLFVLGQIERVNDDPASLFYDHLDLARVGAFGYSLGGSVAAEAAYRDPRIKAVLVLDTPLYGEAAKNGIAQPLMLLCEEIPHPSADELALMSFADRRDIEMDGQDYAHQLPLLRRPGDYQISLPGTAHTSFQDGILTSPLQRFSGAGAIPPSRLIPILRAYSLDFFDQSLRGIASPLLAGKAHPFPEAVVLFSSDQR